MSSAFTNQCAKERLGEEGGLIDVQCQHKQNGKYNLAFSLCRDNGQHEAQTRLKHLPQFIIHQRDTLYKVWVRGSEGKQVNSITGAMAVFTVHA